MKILLAFLLIASNIQALELVVQYSEQCQDRTAWGTKFNDCGAARYYFKGSCKEAKAEIKIFSTALPRCECVEEVCLTEINPHLSPNQQRLLKKPHPESNTPNCHNTTLQSLGFPTGASTQSHPAIYYLIDSPYCSVHEGRPRPGDVIWFSMDHSYHALTERFAFNKTQPGADAPYEIIRIDDYFQENGDDVACQFISSKEAVSRGCQSTSQAITCDLPDDIKEFRSLSPEDLEKIRNLNDLSYRESVLGEAVEQNVIELEKVINQLAREKLGIPSQDDVPADLVQKLRTALIASVPSDEQEAMADYFDRNQKSFIDNLFVISSPDIRTPYSPEITAVIKLAREIRFYSTLPLEHRLAWGLLLLDGGSSTIPRKDFPTLATDHEASLE